jgi:hypothetical protein
VGFLDSVKGLFAPQRSLTTPAPAAPPTESESVAGFGNFGGRVVGPEPTAELRDVAGYGRAGTYEAGQYALLALGNPYVTMGLDHLMRPVADARVDVEPPPESVIGTGKGRISKADADMHTAFLRWMLVEHYPLQRLNKAAAAGALLAGFSLFEPLAHEVDCPAVNRPVWALKDAPQCLPNSLDPSSPWPVDAQGRLVGIGQQGPVGAGGTWKRTVLPAERALLFSWKREAGNFAGTSQLRSVWYIGGKVMPQLLKMIGVTLQKEGPGWPQAISTGPDAKDLTPGQRDDLVQLMANMRAHEAGGFVMPKGWEIDWSFSPVSNKGHILAVIERMGLWILQQFGAQQLVIGTGEVGSRSAGETHDARSMAMVREVLTWLAGVYNGERGEADGLVKRFIDWNFGPQPAYPKVKLTPQRPELGPKEMAEAMGAARTAGVLNPTLADQNSFRERASLPPLSPEEFKELSGAGTTTALNGAQVTAATDLMQRVADGQLPFEAAVEALVTFYNVESSRALKLMATLKNFKPEPKEPPPAPFGGPGAEGDEEGSAGPGRPGMKPPALSASAPRVAWKPSRPLRASEQKLKLNEMDAFFVASRERFEKLIRPEAVGMLGMAGPALERAMADGTLTPAEVAGLPLDTKRLKAAIRSYVAGVRATGAAFLREELAQGPLMAAAGDDPEDTMEAVAEADAVTDASVEALTTRIVNRVRADVEREAIDALRTKGTAQEVVTRTIARQIDTGAFKSDAGSVTTRVFNVGRQEAARIMGGITEVELSEVLDNNTCDVCLAADGKTAEFDSPEHDAMLPPTRDCAGGDQCRGILLFKRGNE